MFPHTVTYDTILLVCLLTFFFFCCLSSGLLWDLSFARCLDNHWPAQNKWVELYYYIALLLHDYYFNIQRPNPAAPAADKNLLHPP